MGWKNTINIMAICILVIISALFFIFETSSYDRAYNQAINEMDLSGCEKLSSLKYTIESKPILFSGGESYYIKNQRQSCIDRTETHFGFYGDNLKKFFAAVKSNKPETCPPSGAYECLDAIKEKYKDHSICNNYTTSEFDKEYQKYTFIFECEAYLIAFEEQDLNYCNQFEGEVKNYCSFIIAREYNKLRRIEANPLVIHQTAEGKNYFRPKPNITYVCNEVKDSALKESCEYVFKEFNSLETPTLA